MLDDACRRRRRPGSSRGSTTAGPRASQRSSNSMVNPWSVCSTRSTRTCPGTGGRRTRIGEQASAVRAWTRQCGRDRSAKTSGANSPSAPIPVSRNRISAATAVRSSRGRGADAGGHADACLPSGEVLLHDGHGRLELGRRAELDDARAGGHQRQVSRRRVVGVTRDVGLLVVGPAEGELAGGDDAPVRALAAVVGQPDEVRRRVDVLLEASRSRPCSRRAVRSVPRSTARRSRRGGRAGWHWAWCPPRMGGSADTPQA